MLVLDSQSYISAQDHDTSMSINSSIIGKEYISEFPVANLLPPRIQNKLERPNQVEERYLEETKTNEQIILSQFFKQLDSVLKYAPDFGPSVYKKNIKILKERFEINLENIITERENKLQDLNPENITTITSFYDQKIQNLRNAKENFRNSLNQKFKTDFLRRMDMVQFQAALPIYSIKNKFLKAVEDNSVVIAKSTAGSGKSTQLPQYLLECTQGRILIVEPRAMAAEAVATRVSMVNFFYFLGN